MRKIFYLLLLGATIYGFLILIKKPSDWTKTQWGINFSKPFSIQMGIDPQKIYLEILDDLKAKYIRLPIYWSDVEKESGKFEFKDYDFFVHEAEVRDTKLILAIGRKLPRWPECHEPDWLNSSNLSSSKKDEKLLNYISTVVQRYKNSRTIEAWQVENEPFLPFGTCPKLNTELLDKEIKLVRSLDSKHKILITDSGELGTWLRAASRGDIFGTTMYRTIWNKYLGYFTYPLPPAFFYFKANLLHLIYKNKPIIVPELQAEPWGPKLLYESPPEDQAKSMNLNKLRENITYAKEVGFAKTYLWGAEWWYLEKSKHNHPEFWNEIKQLLKK